MSKSRWSNEDQLANSAYVFYHGKGTTQVQAVRYIDEKNFIATTGERVSLTRDGINTIPRERLWIGSELKEVDFDYSKWNFLNRILSAIKLGLRGMKVHENKIHDDYQPLYATDQQQGTLNNFNIDLAKASLGQETDTSEHKKKIEDLNMQHPDIKNIVLYGVSRGASTTFNAMTKFQHQYENIKLCVLEGPPASVTSVIKNYVGKFFTNILYNRFTANWFIGEQHSLEKKAQAKAYIRSFPDDIPLVIVTSKKDDLVPHSSSVKLAMGVAAQRIRFGSKKSAPVYLLQLDSPGHNDYTTKNSADSLRYQNFLHAVYKKHGLAYIEEYADKGEKEFATAELTHGLLKKQVQFQNEFASTKDRLKRMGIRRKALAEFNKQFACADNPYDKNRAASLCENLPLYAKPFDIIDNDTITAKQLISGKKPGFFERNPFVKDMLTGLALAAILLLIIGIIGYFAPPLLGALGVWMTKSAVAVVIATHMPLWNAMAILGITFLGGCSVLAGYAGKFIRWMMDKLCVREIPLPDDTTSTNTHTYFHKEGLASSDTKLELTSNKSRTVYPLNDEEYSDIILDPLPTVVSSYKRPEFGII